MKNIVFACTVKIGRRRAIVTVHEEPNGKFCYYVDDEHGEHGFRTPEKAYGVGIISAEGKLRDEIEAAWFRMRELERAMMHQQLKMARNTWNRASMQKTYRL